MSFKLRFADATVSLRDNRPLSMTMTMKSSPNLRIATRLGAYDDRDEYQIDRMLVWVIFGTPCRRQLATELACALFPAVWDAIPQTVKLAQIHSREKHPEFWRSRDATGTADDALHVWGIWLDPFEGKATYDISENLDWGRERDAMSHGNPPSG